MKLFFLLLIALAIITACSEDDRLPGYDQNGEPTVNHEGRGNGYGGT